MTLRDIVYEGLNHHKEHFGIDDILLGTPRDIAGDMLAYDDDIPTYTPVEELVPHIEAWKKEHGIP